MRAAVLVALASLPAGCGRLGFGSDDVASGDGRLTIDAPVIGDATPTCVNRVGGAVSTLVSFGQSVAAKPPYIYLGLADGAQGMQVFDATDPKAIMPQGTFPTDSGPGMISATNNDVLGIAVGDGGYVYLATYLGGLVIVDASDPTNPLFVGKVALPGESWDVAILGNYAYVASLTAGLTIVDITTHTNPTVITTLALPTLVQDVAIRGTTAFAAGGSQFHIVDVSAPSLPMRTGGVTSGLRQYKLTAPGNGFVYVADLDARQIITVKLDPSAHVVDVTPPDSTLDFRAIDGTATELVLGLSSPDGTGAVRVYSLAEPSRPARVGEAPVATGEVFDVAMFNDAFVAAIYETAGVLVWTIGC